MYKLLLCLCLVVAGVTSTTIQEYENQLEQRNGPLEANMNQYVDILMFQVGPWLSNGILPMALPNIIEGFEYSPLLITYRGSLELTNGRFTSMGNVQRAGNAFMTYDRLFLRVAVGGQLRNMNFYYDYSASIMDLGPSGWTDVFVDSATFQADILIDLFDFQVYLQDFRVTQLSGIDVRMRGNILIDWLLNIVINVIAAVFRNTIMNVVSDGIRTFILDVIQTINSRSFSSVSEVESHLMQVMQQQFQMDTNRVK